MKHWSNFLKHRTHSILRMGKMINGLHFELIDLEIQKIKLKKAIKEQKRVIRAFGAEIDECIMSYYPSKKAYEADKQRAKEKANEWNNTPTHTHKPINQK